MDPYTTHFSGSSYGVAFDVPMISHITGNLYVGGVRKGLVLPQDIQHVVSLHPWDSYISRHEIRSTMGVFIMDEPAVNNHLVLATADWVASCLDSGPTLVHCQAGINRSPMVAALALIQKGWTPDGAIALLRKQRSLAVLSNRTFEEFVRP